MLGVRCILLLLPLTSLFLPAFAFAAEPAPIPEDECLLEITLPRGASVTIAGQNYGDKRSLRWRELKPGQWYPVKASVRFAGGETIDRDLFIRGGWRVPLAMLEPGKQRPELVVQSGHTNPVRGIAISSDGSRIATGSLDRAVMLWDGNTGVKLRSFHGHEEYINCLAMTASGDRIVSGAADNSAIVWDTRSGERLHTLRGHSDQVTGLAMAPDGSWIITGSWDARLIQWRGGEDFDRRILPATIKGVAASADGSLVATTSFHNAITVWNGRTGRELHVLRSHTNSIHGIAISADGSRLISGSEDKKAILWDLRTGDLLHTFRAHEGAVNCVAISADGSRVATASEDTTAILWNARTGERLLHLKGHSKPVHAVAMTPDGRRIVTGSDDYSAILWDGSDGSQLHTYQQHTDWVTNVASTPNSTRIVVGMDGGAASVWNGVTGERTHVLKGHANRPCHVAMTPDGRVIATDSEALPVILWNGETGEQRRTLTGHSDKLFDLSLTADGSRLAAGSKDKTALVWDCHSGQLLHTLRGHSETVGCLAISPSGDYIVTGSVDNSAIVWNGQSGEKLHVLQGHSGSIWSTAITPDGSRIVTAPRDGSVAVWDGRTGERMQSLRDGNQLANSVAISEDGSKVFAGLDNNEAIVWNAIDGEKIRSFKGHSSSVYGVTIVSGGNRAITSSADGTVGLWDTATGDLLCQLISLDEGKDWLVVTPEGLFDGSPGGREKVTFRIPGEEGVVKVDRFFQDFYRPGLLAALLRGERPMPEIEIGRALPPVVRITSPDAGEVNAGEVTLEVEAIDQGGGILPLTLFHNGARMLGRGEQVREGDTLRRTFSVALLEGENRLRVSSASADGSWESEPAEIVLRYARAVEKPRLHLVAVGIGEYAQADLRLTCPPHDAQTLSDLFTQRGKALYEQVNARVLLDRAATREGILTALKEAGAASRPQDTLVVFLAGHGKVLGERYYFVPQEFAKKAGEDFAAGLRAQGLSAEEIGEFLTQARALKRVLILDTCQSAGALGTIDSTASGFELRGAVERLSRNQGVFTIAASGAEEEAFESNELGHGVLTYTLLAALKGIDRGPLADRHVQPNSEQGVVDIMEWFTFASGQAPRVSEKLFGQQQRVEMGLQGQSFPLLPLR